VTRLHNLAAFVPSDAPSGPDSQVSQHRNGFYGETGRSSWSAIRARVAR
jgi:hypothetical protein